MKIHYRGPFGQHTGYAQAGHDYLLALHLAGHEIDIEPLFEWDHLDRRYDLLRPLVERCEEPGWADVLICHAPPFGCARLADDELAPPPGVHRVAMTTWETSALPGNIGADLSRHFDCVMVPCEQNQRALVHGESELSKPCHVLPHCYDTSFWRQKERANGGTYAFYYVGAWNYRKNPRGVVMAFLSAFTKDDDVVLVLKTGGAQNIAAEIEGIKRSLNRPSYAPIELITGRLDDTQLLELHRSGDCFVSAHRGEGWGLGIFEAAVVGNPFIATGFGGPCDFNNPNFDSLLDFQQSPAMVPEEVVPTRVPGVSAVRRVDPTGIGGDQWWAEPNIWALRQLMQNQVRRVRSVRDDRISFQCSYGYGAVAHQFARLLG